MLGHNDLFRHIVLVGPFVELLQLYFLFLILIFPLPLDHFSLCVGVGWCFRWDRFFLGGRWVRIGS